MISSYSFTVLGLNSCLLTWRAFKNDSEYSLVAVDLLLPDFCGLSDLCLDRPGTFGGHLTCLRSLS